MVKQNLNKYHPPFPKAYIENESKVVKYTSIKKVNWFF